MNLNQLKSIFQQKLNSIYPSREIKSIFQILVEHHLHWNLTQQVLNDSLQLETRHLKNLLQDLEELERNRPIQQIIGEAWFMDMPFWVNENVLIPRPETEELVYLIAKKNKRPDLIVSDICSGSGCIAIGLATLLPGSTLSAYEMSEAAVAVARYNHKKLVPNANIIWYEQDVLNSQFIRGDEDIIVSNPPYIPKSEHVHMQDNVLRFEPHMALFTPDDDPLIFYREIVRQMMKYAKNEAQVYLECHEKYASQTAVLLRTGGLKDVSIIHDMQQKARMISAKK